MLQELEALLAAVNRELLRRVETDTAAGWEANKMIASAQSDVADVVASQVSVRDLKTHLCQ